MAHIKKQKRTKVEVTETIHYESSKMVSPALSFFGSFILIVGFVFGIYWYGKQLYQTVKTIFRTPLTIKLPVTRTLPTTAYFDPLDLIESVKKKRTDIVILDVRSSAEYHKEHVKNAVLFPSYSIENDTVKYADIQSMIKKINIDKSKFIVIYGPSSSFQFQQTILSEFKKDGYNAQLLAVGWNELRHFQNIWLPEPLWGKVDITSFIDNANDQ